MSTPPRSPPAPSGSTESPPAAGPSRPPPVQSMTFFMPFRPLNNGGPSSAAPAGPPGTEQERPGIMWTVEVREEGAPSPNGPPPHTEAGQTAPEGPVPPSSTTDGSGQAPPPHRPQAPRLPPFFFVTPDGATHPGFFPIPPPHLAPQPPGNQPHPPMIGAPVPPWMTFGQPPPMFSFFMPVPMPSEPQPDPVKAAELIRSLPAVGRNLMKRIDRIISAEGPRRGDDDLEHGWKCGICLEGVEDAESKETGVKALPCNHLYHSACLEPWLTTRHTCPACRLDLDPLHTLHTASETPPSPARPTSAGTPSTSFHPYARGPENPAPSPGEVRAALPPSTAPPQPLQTPSPFIWRMPIPMPEYPAPPEGQRSSVPSPQPEPNPNVAGDQASSSTAPQLTPPRIPNMLFNVPLHTSPMPMNRTASAPSASTPVHATQAPNLAPTSAMVPRPHPERRPHIAIFRGPNAPPNPHQHHHHHHHVVHHLARPPPEHHHAPPPQPIGGNASPDFQFFMTAPRPPPPGETAASTPKSAPFVPQSLESWTEQREKALGWRCDGTECLIAPSTDPDGDIDMQDDDVSPEGKEMLSIHSPLQLSIHEQGGEHGQFVINSCEHRWHRACLETAERSSGRRLIRAEGDGRLWVSCQRCRRDGWVEDVESTPSEGESAEVERMVTA